MVQVEEEVVEDLQLQEETSLEPQEEQVEQEHQIQLQDRLQYMQVVVAVATIRLRSAGASSTRPNLYGRLVPLGPTLRTISIPKRSR